MAGGTTTGIIQVAKAAISKTTSIWATITTIRTVHLQVDRVVQAVAAVVQAVAAVVQAVAAAVQVVAAAVQAVGGAVGVVVAAEDDVEAYLAFIYNLDFSGTLHRFIRGEPERWGFSQILVPLLDCSSEHFSFCV